jgi:glucokinase
MERDEGDLYLGVDLGSTKTAVSLWRARGQGDAVERIGSVRWETLPEGPDANIERIVEAGRSLIEERAGGESPRAIGVSGGGPLDPERGVILNIPNAKGWNDVPLARVLSERLGAPVRLENDANAGAVAEWLYGAGRGATSLAFLTCSTGIGAGLIWNGKLYRGHRFLAGEVGHLVVVPGGLECGCGNKGCLEAYASGAGIAGRLQYLRRQDEEIPGTARELIEEAKAGDIFCKAFLRETAQYLAAGLANLIYTLNPQRLILGTLVASAGDLILVPLRRALAERVWPSLLEGVEILPSALWPDLGDYAALAVAKDLAEVADS